MKKLLSIALVLVLVLSLGATAFAANGATYDATLTSNTITITKTLTANGPEGTQFKYPGDTLQFTASAGVVTEATEGTTAPALPAIENVTVAEGATSATITVKLPAFTTVGVYTYEITETDTNVAGVTYRTDAIKLVLTVIEQDGKKVVAAVHCEAQGETKTDTFENIFDAGSLKVSKTVTGNLGDKQKDWNFKVTFTAPTGDTVNSSITCTDSEKNIAAGWTGSKEVEFVLKHNESIQFDNIPAGVTYTVAETEANADGYTTTKTGDSGTIAKKTISEAAFTNNKDVTVDTGIVLDSLPYILLVAVVLSAAAVMFVNKRRSEV